MWFVGVGYKFTIVPSSFIFPPTEVVIILFKFRLFFFKFF